MNNDITTRVQIKDNVSKNCCLLLAIALSGKMNAMESAYTVLWTTSVRYKASVKQLEQKIGYDCIKLFPRNIVASVKLDYRKEIFYQ